MLPDTLQNLPRDERYAYARLLAYMARVDEEITVDELAMFEQQLGKALLSPNQREVLRRSLKSPPTLEECLDGLGPEAGRLALRDAVLMAARGALPHHRHRNHAFCRRPHRPLHCHATAQPLSISPC